MVFVFREFVLCRLTSYLNSELYLNIQNMKSDTHYESPLAAVHYFQPEGNLCISGTEFVEENEGTWGDLIDFE
jgi:hypothetical protein